MDIIDEIRSNETVMIIIILIIVAIFILFLIIGQTVVKTIICSEQLKPLFSFWCT